MTWKCLKLQTERALELIENLEKQTRFQPLAQVVLHPEFGIYRRGSMADNMNTLYFTPVAAQAFGHLIDPLGAEPCETPPRNDPGDPSDWLNTGFANASAWDRLTK